MSELNPAAAQPSEKLDPLTFPLTKSRLIEASAGTGKTYTIAALYIRLVLGHRAELGFGCALEPSRILVMTFTKAATKELSDRIRARLVEAAAYFRGETSSGHDPFLAGLTAEYGEPQERMRAAHRLSLAAEAMDDSAVFTIDSWCQRMLREHAFDSGSLFDEELISDEKELRVDALRDYWREQVYALDLASTRVFRSVFSDFDAFVGVMDKIVSRAHMIDGSQVAADLGELIVQVTGTRDQQLAAIKQQWAARAPVMKAWLLDVMAADPKALKANSINPGKVNSWFDALQSWISDPAMHYPSADAFNDTAWKNLSADGLRDCFSQSAKGKYTVPAEFDHTAKLKAVLDGIADLTVELRRHAAVFVYKRLALLKARKRQAGFHDMLMRLRNVLRSDAGAALRERIRQQYPVALIDEFQDTSPEQYEVFDAIYTIANPTDGRAFFMIGDPKQAIYSFRGADIQSYLTARAATTGRHYRLEKNFRSTKTLVTAVNHLFDYAERRSNVGVGHGKGAFRFRDGDLNPLPFDPVAAQGRDEEFVCGTQAGMPLTIWVSPDSCNADTSRAHFAALTGERIAHLLNDAQCGFRKPGSFRRVKPADIAILVRDRKEAAAVRKEMQRRNIRSVYLSDNESIFQGQQAVDLLAWMKAVASPLDGSLARAAYATPTACRPLATLAAFVDGDAACEEQAEFLTSMKTVWQKQGVLSMIRQFILGLELPSLLLSLPGGERMMTDLLHLAEQLQAASYKVEGEQSLIRWLSLQIERGGNDGEDRAQRLESDADLVKVVTIYKSKGLQYPLVFLPFAASAKPVKAGKGMTHCEYTDEDKIRKLELTVSDKALKAMEKARLEEELRLFYVALTRAEFAVWMGVATLSKTDVGVTAVGHIVDGTGKKIPAAELADRVQQATCGCADIAVEIMDVDLGVTRFDAGDAGAPCLAPEKYVARFERDWSVSSYSSITKTLSDKPAGKAPESPMEDKLQQEADSDAVTAQVTSPSAWHGFPRGPLAGQFLHDQLEWLAHEGFATAHQPDFSARFGERCKISGWENHAPAAVAWLKAVVATAVPAIGCSLQQLAKVVPEMEFWVPAGHVQARDIDALCTRHTLPGSPRPAISSRHVKGMMRGFIDLVFEHEGRYWVLDYKGSRLGADDNAYAAPDLQDAILANRYDIQGAIYLLALHRLLESRLGDRYDPAEHLGGVIFFFLRGIQNTSTRGCIHLPADPLLLDELGGLLTAADIEEEIA
jgi:exodeoxyribonuclease V beta subunit